MKKIIALLFLWLLCNIALAQTFPVNNLQVNGTANLNGGTTVTTSFTATGLVTTSDIATQAANTVLANTTGSVASPTAFAMPSCSTASSAVTWTTSTGFTCNTSINAATLGGVTANTSGGPALVNGAITVGDCLKWSASGIQDAATCYDNNVINVRNFGALGNSNGTHGNGNDDTTAFQNALNAAPGVSLYIPCGVYRITAPLTVTDANPRWIYGHGQCSRIYSDQAVAATTFNFNPGGVCGSGSNAPCLVMANLVFLAPNTLGAGQIAVSLSKTNSPYFDNVSFVGQQVGISFSNSFAPRIHNSRFFGGVTGIFAQDISFNSGEIWSDSFFNQTTAISIVPASSCAVAFSIRNNDMEQNGTAMTLAGICSGDISNNYIEASHTQTIFNFGSSGGGLQNITFYNNSINGATDSGTGAEQFNNLLQSQFVNNSFFNWTVTYGTGVGRIRIRASENYLVSTTLPLPSLGPCTGLGTGGTCAFIAGADDWAGEIQLNTGTGPLATGNVTVTFSNSVGPNHGHCNWFPIANATNWTAPVSFIGGSGSATSTLVNWQNGAALPASNNVLLAYTCQGY